jgi:hypothetical protein
VHIWKPNSKQLNEGTPGSSQKRPRKKASTSALSRLLTGGQRVAAVALVAFACNVIVCTQSKQNRVQVVNNTGSDLGVKINAADKALGPGAGEITVRGGGVISTQVILSSDHTLHFMPGQYQTRTTVIPILMKSRSTLIGSGWESIIFESTAPGQFTIVSAYNQSNLNGAPDSVLVIRDLQFKGANPGFNSAPQALSLGNCSNCTVDKVWMNGTRSIGIQLGASSLSSHWAENSKVTNCLFTRVASQNLALVNGTNITFEGNRFMTSGQQGGPGNTNIDVEPNEATDRVQNIVIRNNLIDVRNSEMSPTGNGIVVQATTGTSYVGPILIEGNKVIGGSFEGTITNVLSNGIYVFGGTMRDVTIRNNAITRTGQSGINVQGSHFVVTNNSLKDVGGGGTPGFVVDLTDSQVTDNTFSYSGSGPVDGNIVIKPSSQRNVFRNNSGFTMSGNVR